MAKEKYLLSTGVVTGQIEKYIVDLFRLNMQILPKEIPGSSVGFDFILTGVNKDRVVSEVRLRMENLAGKIRSMVGLPNISILIESVEPITSKTIRVNIKVSNYIESVLVNYDGDQYLTIE